MLVELIRHGTTEYNEKLKLCGISDISISLNGSSELKEYKKMNIYPKVDFCYISALKRTKETKDIIYPNIPFKAMKEINEGSCGDFEGIEFMNYLNSINPISDFVNHTNDDICPPNGESYNQLLERVKETFPMLLEDAFKNNYKKIAVIGHGSYFVQLLHIFLNDNRQQNDLFFKNGRGIELLVEKNNNQYKIEKIRDI